MKRVLPLLLLATLSTSCFTTHLWGGSVGPDNDGDGAAELNVAVRVHSWSGFVGRLLLSPFTVVLDVCTFPIQAVVFGWEDDDDDGDLHPAEEH